MEKDKHAYYVVQKGDVLGFYKSLKDCQDQAGYSIFGSNATVYKVDNLSKEAEQYLASHGLQNATHSISSSHLTNDLFGELLACRYEQPSDSKGKTAEEYSEAKRSREAPETRYAYVGGPFFVIPNRPEQKYDLDSGSTSAASSRCSSYILEFDGASKGNPGISGAGAILRAEDGSMVCRLQEGVGFATNNVAEYRAVILGLKHALKNGIKNIRVQGDSNLVCMQIQGLWKIKNQKMGELCRVAKELKDKFTSFEINHIPRELNSEADALANRGIYLRDGEVVEDCTHK